MGEQTLVRTVSLPAGQDWAWYADLNVIGLSDRLSRYGRELALSQLQWWWRMSCLQDDKVKPPPNGFVVSGNVAV